MVHVAAVRAISGQVGQLSRRRVQCTTRTPRRRTHQRARGTGRVVRPPSFRSARAGADGSDCHRLQSDRIRRLQHDIAVAEDPHAPPRAAQLVRDGGRYPINASHPFGPEQLGIPAVPPKRHSRVGVTSGSYPSHETQNRAFLVARQRPRTLWFYPILPRTRRPASPRASARLVPVPSAKARRRNDFSQLARARLVSGRNCSRSSRTTYTHRGFKDLSMDDHRVRFRRLASQTWAWEGFRAAQRLLRVAMGPNTAAHLVGVRYSTTTQGNYQGHWQRFVAYCNANNLQHMPAAPSTLCSYLGYLFHCNAVRGGSIRPYVAAIAEQHRRHGFPSPTDDPLVDATRRGYRAQDARRTDGPPERSAPLPAKVAAYALRRALAVPVDARKACQLATLREYGLLVVTFLICARPASVRELLTSDIQISRREIALQLRHFKYSDTGVVLRIALRVPITNDADGIGLLLRRLASAAPRSGQLFPDRTLRKAASAATLSRFVASALAETGTLAPPGLKFTPRSLRSSGISCAYVFGLLLELVMRLPNHSDKQVVLRHYLDPQTRPCADAQLFFARFRTRTVHGE